LEHNLQAMFMELLQLSSEQEGALKKVKVIARYDEL